MLALRHLDIKEEKKIEEIRRMTEFRRFITKKAIFCPRRTETFQPSELGTSKLGPPEFQPSELGYLETRPTRTLSVFYLCFICPFLSGSSTMRTTLSTRAPSPARPLATTRGSPTTCAAAAGPSEPPDRAPTRHPRLSARARAAAGQELPTAARQGGSGLSRAESRARRSTVSFRAP